MVPLSLFKLYWYNKIPKTYSAFLNNGVPYFQTSRDTTHTELSKITNMVSKIQFRGKCYFNFYFFLNISNQLSSFFKNWLDFVTGNTTDIDEISIQSILPANHQYMTYEGSVTQPGCYETVTWILLNKPAFVGEHQVFWRNLFLRSKFLKELKEPEFIK